MIRQILQEKNYPLMEKRINQYEAIAREIGEAAAIKYKSHAKTGQGRKANTDPDLLLHLQDWLHRPVIRSIFSSIYGRRFHAPQTIDNVLEDLADEMSSISDLSKWYSNFCDSKLIEEDGRIYVRVIRGNVGGNGYMGRDVASNNLTHILYSIEQ